MKGVKMSRHKKIYILLVDYIQNNQEKFYRVAFSYCKSKEDALDIVQDAIYKALKSYKSVHTEQYIASWFYRILINTSITHLRRKKDVVPFGDVEEVVLEEKEYLDLYDSIDKLLPEERTLIILRFFEDLKIKDISDILEINTNTIKTRLYKVLKKLKVELDCEVEHE